ncbi:phage tail protein [Streptomyces sp. NPDC048255]|uniref:phage tail protein n=1 Tax=Streptomyces sp. NPDC048255 TaxID=3154713 RepID=UPI00340914BC
MLGDALSGNRFSVQLGKFQVETVQSVSGLTIDQDVIEVKQVTADGVPVVRKQPGAVQSGQITVTRGMDQSAAFTDWIKQSVANKTLDRARQNVTIAVLDAQKNPVQRFHLTNAWASHWSGSDLDAGDSGVATETVTIEYEEITAE